MSSMFLTKAKGFNEFVSRLPRSEYQEGLYYANDSLAPSLPTSGNTGFQVLEAPVVSGEMHEEDFVACCYEVKVEAIGKRTPDELWETMCRCGLELHVGYGSFQECTIYLPEGHHWNAFLRESYDLKEKVPIYLVVQNYGVLNYEGFAQTGVIVSRNFLDRIQDMV